MNTFPCSIPADPDISGVGVRTAIYAQNLLSFIPAIWALWDGEVSAYELECVETQSTTILVTAFAILISAMVQANRGLSNFHASIVLDLSWMNNTNTFIYFLLCVQHKSQPGPQQIKPTFHAWIKHLRGSLSWRLHDDKSTDAENTVSTAHHEKNSAAESSKPVLQQKSWFKAGLRRIVMVLGTLHLSLMAGLGLWLWSDTRSFGPDGPCVLEIAHVVILGRSVPLGSTGLRGWSIAIYSLLLAPGLNLIVPMALFLGLFLGYQTWNKSRRHGSSPISASHGRSQVKTSIRGLYNALLANTGLRRIWGRIGAWYHRLPATPSVLPTVVGMALLFATNVIFLVDIELTLRRNRTHQTGGESEWTFGQILAMLLLVLPLRDLIETVLARREKRRLDEHAASLRNAIQDEAPMKTIVDLVKNGAEVNMYVKDCARYPTALVLAASRGDVDCVEALLAYGADPNIRALGHSDTTISQSAVKNRHLGPTEESALVLACQCGYKGVVEVLLKHGADPNAAPGNDLHRGIEDTTPLQAASHSRELAIVEVLLAHGADVNRQGRHYGTALQACSWSGELGIAKLLVERGADVNIQGGSFGTALQAASAGGNLTIVQLLLEHGADVTMYGGRYGTALHAAAHQGNLPIVKLLLERGADIHVRGPPARGGQRVPVFGGTVLYEASGSGNLAMVELLLERGADVNVQGGRFATALQAAISSQNDAERLDVIKLLLERGADVNIQAGEYCTALIAASSWNIPEVVELLLAHGADINVRGGMVNHTPLHAALHGLRLSLDGGHDKVVGAGTETMKLLLSRGADPNLPLSNRRSILEIIDEHDPCRDELTDLLLAHGAV